MKCKVEGCTKESWSRGFCGTHYGRFYRYGNPSIIKKKGAPLGSKNPNWRGGIAEYPNQRTMLKLRLQKLQQVNYKCEMCGNAAREIHHINGDKADHRIENFMALCHKCHFKNFHGHKVPKMTSKYKRLIGMTLKECANKNQISIYEVYKLLDSKGGD